MSIYEGRPDDRTSLAAFTELGFEISAMFPVSRDQHLWLVELDCAMTRTPERP